MSTWMTSEQANPNPLAPRYPDFRRPWHARSSKSILTFHRGGCYTDSRKDVVALTSFAVPVMSEEVCLTSQSDVTVIIKGSASSPVISSS